VQDGEHVLLDCLSADLADLRIKHHHLFCSLFSGTNRLRDTVGPPDTKRLALFVQERLDCCTKKGKRKKKKNYVGSETTPYIN